MKFTALGLVPNPPELRVAPVHREWMDATPRKFAYLCLPLTMANRSGWEVLNPVKFSAVWNGGMDPGSVQLDAEGDSGEMIAQSHFGSGIITFRIGYLFRTEAAYGLIARGSPNQVKDGVAPLEGFIESDWLPYPFTMNWKITRPNHPIVFDAGEPICFIAPTQRRILEEFEPNVLPVGEDQKEWYEYQAWLMARKRFDDAREDEESLEAEQGWARHYLRGRHPWGDAAPDHTTSLNLKPFHGKGKSEES